MTLPILAESTIPAAKMSGCPYIFIPLHKGVDTFMSLDQFKNFYWPSLRELMIQFIDEGLVPCPLWEGNGDSRLEVIKDIPQGKAIYIFEKTDIFPDKDGRYSFWDLSRISGMHSEALTKKLWDMAWDGLISNDSRYCSAAVTRIPPTKPSPIHRIRRRYWVESQIYI